MATRGQAVAELARDHLSPPARDAARLAASGSAPPGAPGRSPAGPRSTSPTLLCWSSSRLVGLPRSLASACACRRAACPGAGSAAWRRHLGSSAVGARLRRIATAADHATSRPITLACSSSLPASGMLRSSLARFRSLAHLLLDEMRELEIATHGEMHAVIGPEPLDLAGHVRAVGAVPAALVGEPVPGVDELGAVDERLLADTPRSAPRRRRSGRGCA